MSKVNQMYMKQLEDEFELNLAYEEFLRDNFKEPQDDELDLMEEDLIKPSSTENQSITKTSLNNPNYDPTYTA